ncbi:MAG: alkaline phosphatase family protein [Ardenticatenaceae bacterium]|nr:alkaline phosphatase family protein [Ardenticatenaceae bacterium]
MTLNLPDEFVRPLYNGRSIANIPATVAHLLNAPFAGLPRLQGELWQPMGEGIERVVVILLDAMGWNLYEEERPFFQEMLGQTAVAERITSVFPSTTVAALSALWTGYAPAQHSLLGFRLFLPDYATVGQLINFTPAFGYYNEILVKSGLKPEEFLQVPGVAQQLQTAVIPTYSFKDRAYVKSALSLMHGRGVQEEIGVASFADMMVQMRQMLEAKAGERLYAFAYWATIDSLSHHYSWQHPAVKAELHALLYQIRTELFAPLSAAARRGTAVFIAADHGQAVCPPAEQIQLRDHPELDKMLLMQPTGDPRAVYLYAKHGRQTDIIHYIHQNLSHAFTPILSEDALEAGLFGPQPHAAAAPERVGDVVLIARHGAALLNKLDDQRASQFVGWHGSLAAADMWVPWLGYRLDRPS